MTGPKIDIKTLPYQATLLVKKLQPYIFVIFLVFVGLIYGFILLRISSLRNIEPSQAAVSGQVKAARIPRIDPSVVKQINSLQDNSVSVKALFDEARNNPFQQ
jgi:hypothetical protein